MEIYLVSRCCGDTFEEVEIIEDWNNQYICSDCGEYCDTMTNYDYGGLVRYDRDEAMEDERRAMRR